MSSAHIVVDFQLYLKLALWLKEYFGLGSLFLHLVWSFRITYFLSSFYSKSPHKNAFANYYKCQYFF